MSDFVEARGRLAGRARMGPKVMSAAAAAALVHDGDHVALGGCLFSRPPVALVHELIRQGRRRLTVSRSLLGFEGELLMAAGSTDRVVTSWQGLGLRWGLSKVLRSYVESGAVGFDEWSHLSLGLRYRAGAMGVPFLPTFSMLGSDLAARAGSVAIDCPFTGRPVNLIPALFPDVALIHVHRADERGNAQIDGYVHMDPDIALASTTVILSAEEIVSGNRIRQEPDRTVIPAMAVDAVVEAPGGAFPGECYGAYETEFSHFDAYVEEIKTGGVGAVSQYLERYVTSSRDHQAFLDLIGRDRLALARQRARELLDTGTARPA